MHVAGNGGDVEQYVAIGVERGVEDAVDRHADVVEELEALGQGPGFDGLREVEADAVGSVPLGGLEAGRLLPGGESGKAAAEGLERRTIEVDGIGEREVEGGDHAGVGNAGGGLALGFADEVPADDHVGGGLDGMKGKLGEVHGEVGLVEVRAE